MNARPPRLARWLLRIAPLRDRRDEITEDLDALFAARLESSGPGFARRRYYRDVLSLWRVPRTEAPAERRLPRMAPGAVIQDLRFARRLFLRSPGTVAVTVLGLAIGIGVGTAVFTILNSALLQGDEIPERNRVARVERVSTRGISTSWPFAEFSDLRAGATSIRLEAWMPDSVRLRLDPRDEEPPKLTIAFVSGGYFQTLRVNPAIGRTLERGDELPGAAPSIVISHRLWERRFSSDPAILGRTVWIGAAPVTIAGVVERGFTGQSNQYMAIWAPMAIYPTIYGGSRSEAESSRRVNVIGRLADGESYERAAAELNRLSVTIAGAHDDREQLRGASLDSSRIPWRQSRGLMTVVTIVLVVIGLLVLLSCVNVASLLLASATARSQEIGLRLALGASRARVMRQLLTESLFLGTLGGVGGLLLAVWLVPILGAAVRMPEMADVRIDLRVYAFLVLITAAAGVGAGLAPARHGTRGDLLSPLKGGTGHASVKPGRLRSVLVGTQAAASVVLIVLATLLVRAAVTATRVDVGFDARPLVVASIAFDRSTHATPAAVAGYVEHALERVRSTPGVERASLTLYPPYGGASEVSISEQDGRRYTTFFHRTDADYFGTLGLRVVRGRTYTAAEVSAHAPVAVISETVARDSWGGEEPIGASLGRLGPDANITVIGVVADAITARLGDRSAAIVYQPLPAGSRAVARLLVRSRSDAADIAGRIRETLRSAGADTTITVAHVADGLEEEIAVPRTLAMLASTLAAIALALSAIGLYGVTCFAVGLRRPEIGLRVAIGAERRDVLRLLITDGLRPVFAGLAAGVALALLVGRAMSGALFGVPPHDPLAFAAAVGVLLIVAFAAVIVPTRRAVSVDPALVLRQA